MLAREEYKTHTLVKDKPKDKDESSLKKPLLQWDEPFLTQWNLVGASQG